MSHLWSNPMNQLWRNWKQQWRAWHHQRPLVNQPQPWQQQPLQKQQWHPQPHLRLEARGAQGVEAQEGEGNLLLMHVLHQQWVATLPLPFSLLPHPHPQNPS